MRRRCLRGVSCLSRVSTCDAFITTRCAPIAEPVGATPRHVTRASREILGVDIAFEGAVA